VSSEQKNVMLTTGSISRESFDDASEMLPVVSMTFFYSLPLNHSRINLMVRLPWSLVRRSR